MGKRRVFTATMIRGSLIANRVLNRMKSHEIFIFSFRIISKHVLFSQKNHALRNKLVFYPMINYSLLYWFFKEGKWIRYPDLDVMFDYWFTYPICLLTLTCQREKERQWLTPNTHSCPNAINFTFFNLFFLNFNTQIEKVLYLRCMALISTQYQYLDKKIFYI